MLEKIGEGGMGEVYRAVHLSLQRTVAVKFLSNPNSVSQTPVTAFQRESRLMAALTHPNVVAVHDCGMIEGMHYMVMDYVAGSSLRARLHPGQPLPMAEAGRLLEAIAHALSYIHAQGILHLDLKPENVLCGKNGEIKITDFGLALPRVDARTLSESGLTRGTIDYCAPEQRHGLRVNRRTDLFALATLAYEMLTGEVPGRVYRSAREYNPQLPAEVDGVLAQGLARDAEERYASVEEFRAHLSRALQTRRAGWLRWGLLASILVLVLLALLAGQYYLQDILAGER
jgi:serine/threonine-protein kinase